jgi:hypothetical protein
MLEQWMNDPSKVTASAVLLTGIAAFYKVLILPRQMHDAVIAQLIGSHKEAIRQLVDAHADVIARLETDIARERQEKRELMNVLYGQVDVSKKSLTMAEHVQKVRGDVFNKRPEDEGAST